MENASKALLMAAGVLIGILILSLAVYLFFNFASTSSELHKEIEINQINQFNAQFTQYEGKSDITFYDIITITNLARDNNEYKELTQDLDGNDYITIIVKKKSTIINNMERKTQSEINVLLENDLTAFKQKLEKSKDNVELTKYSCKAEISTITRRVKKVTFTEI